MGQDIREGRWLQLRGRVKRTWARFTGNDTLAADGNADVVAGALQESYGTAKTRTAREIERGVDALASFAKRTARTLDK
jgi:uncharacterized protein YjbJ (UPF0337 family)